MGSCVSCVGLIVAYVSGGTAGRRILCAVLLFGAGGVVVFDVRPFV